MLDTKCFFIWMLNVGLLALFHCFSAVTVFFRVHHSTSVTYAFMLKKIFFITLRINYRLSEKP